IAGSSSELRWRPALAGRRNGVVWPKHRPAATPGGFPSGQMRKAGLEPARLAALEPKSSASTSSATFARGHCAGDGAPNETPGAKSGVSLLASGAGRARLVQGPHEFFVGFVER